MKITVILGVTLALVGNVAAAAPAPGLCDRSAQNPTIVTCAQ